MTCLLSREEIRNRVIRIIAATRFPFVDQTDWGEDYITITNDSGKRVRCVSGPSGFVYPSMVRARVKFELDIHNGDM